MRFIKKYCGGNTTLICDTPEETLLYLNYWNDGTIRNIQWNGNNKLLVTLRCTHKLSKYSTYYIVPQNNSVKLLFEIDREGSTDIFIADFYIPELYWVEDVYIPPSIKSKLQLLNPDSLKQSLWCWRANANLDRYISEKIQNYYEQSDDITSDSEESDLEYDSFGEEEED